MLNLDTKMKMSGKSLNILIFFIWKLTYKIFLVYLTKTNGNVH